MHRRLNDITKSCPTNFHFREWQTDSDICYVRIYFFLNEHIYFCDSPIRDARTHINISNSNNSENHKNNQPSTSLDADIIVSRKNSPSSFNRHPYPSHSKSHSNRTNNLDMLNTQPLQPTNILEEQFPQIDWYEYHEKSSRFYIRAGKALYYFDDKPSLDQIAHSPIQVKSSVSNTKSDFYPCPCNPDLVLFLRGGQIWCTNLKTMHETKMSDVYFHDNLAQNHEPLSFQSRLPPNLTGLVKSLDSEAFLVGRSSYLMREEFRRNQSIWWCPGSQMHPNKLRTDYMFLYEVTDQSNVESHLIPSWDGTYEEQRYPKPGSSNAVSRLRLTKFKLSPETGEVHNIVTSEVVNDLKDVYADCEYLIRVGWLGTDAIWFQMLNRRQTHLALAIKSLSNSIETQIIYEEDNVHWISAHDILHFLNVSKLVSQTLSSDTILSFIWSSEETGHRHLYLNKVQLGKGNRPSRLIFRRQLTEGAWETSDKELWVDEEEMLIYFCGLRDTPLEKQLYVLSYADCFDESPSDPTLKTKLHRLTELNYTHSNIAFNTDCSVFVNIQSNISIPPFGFVNSIVPQTKFRRDSRRLPDSRRLALLLVNSFNYSLSETSHLDYIRSIGTRPSIMYECQADLLPGLAQPELFCCQLSNGELIYGSVFKPEFMESGVRYPTVLEIYGGPEVQLVSNSFTSLRQPTRHLLSSEGYVVVLIDCRGSGKRGLSFESYTQKRMGQVEIADQVEVLKWLSKSTGYIDLNRVAVKGWSYGGYLSLMAIAQYPKLFKIAIAGAPVTDWLHYDSAYTERFMGCPSENIDGYHKGNVLNYAHLFPDQ